MLRKAKHSEQTTTKHKKNKEEEKKKEKKLKEREKKKKGTYAERLRLWERGRSTGGLTARRSHRRAVLSGRFAPGSTYGIRFHN